MDAQQFLAEFGHVANAPGGVDSLRAMVLSLAFSGRLTTSSGKSVEPLIEAIERQRAAANIETRVQRLARDRAHRSVDQGYFAIPDGWRWVSLSAVGHTCGQKKPTGDFYYIDVSSIDNKAGVLSPVLEVVSASAAPSRARKIVKKGTLIYSTVRPYLLNVAIVNRDVNRELIASTAFAVVHPWRGIEARYLYHYLRSPHFVRYVESVQIGMAYPAISDDKFYSGLVPIPPTEEQVRIVAKVDELMALCDQLEQQQQDRRKLQNALRQATLQALASAQSPHELQTSWQRLQANFGRLFSEPNDVRQLRDVLFDLSLRGLTLTNSKLTADGEEKTTEFGSLPNGWSWKILAELSEYITSGSRGWKAYISSSGDSFIRSQDIRQDALVFENPAFVTLPDRTEGKRTLVREGDLLLTITGGNVGRCAAVHSLKNTAYVSQHVALIRLKRPELYEFIHYWMINAYGGRAFLARYIYGDKPGLNLTQVGSVPVPIPPATVLPEILASLRKHQELCGELAEQLGAGSEVASRLAAAGIAALTGINIEQSEDTAVKAPQTELIVPLRLATPPDVRAQAPLATILARHEGVMAARDLWQRFGGEIDAFYAQLKTEVAHGWIAEPEPAHVREKPTAETAKA